VNTWRRRWWQEDAKQRRHIAVVAGHWIDPAEQVGAPGEREFNMKVADNLTVRLRRHGWTVLRPEREHRSLHPDTWDGYLQVLIYISPPSVPCRADRCPPWW
jgi:hypothetical protein